MPVEAPAPTPTPTPTLYLENDTAIDDTTSFAINGTMYRSNNACSWRYS